MKRYFHKSNWHFQKRNKHLDTEFWLSWLFFSNCITLLHILLVTFATMVQIDWNSQFKRTNWTIVIHNTSIAMIFLGYGPLTGFQWEMKVYFGIPEPKNVSLHPGGHEPASWARGPYPQIPPSAPGARHWQLLVPRQLSVDAGWTWRFDPGSTMHGLKCASWNTANKWMNLTKWRH